MMEKTVIVLAILICLGLVVLVRRLRSTDAAQSPARKVLKNGSSKSHATLVAYASQSGFAELLAWRTANALSNTHAEIDLLTLSEVSVETLAQYKMAYFIVSTTGDGEPPDNARKFYKRVMRRRIDLSRLSYALLALGDRTYEHFCAFGVQLDNWLSINGAIPLHEPTLVDNADDYTLQKWQSLISPTPGNSHRRQPNDLTRWLLSERRLLNPKSDFEKLFLISLRSKDPALLHWRPGDIASIYPAQPQDVFSASTHSPREYTIASIPESGTLDLIVRQRLAGDGDMGISSRWLTETVAPDDILCIRIRKNAKIALPPPNAPYILIAAGSGMAGVRAQLQYRATREARRNWLIYGERGPSDDRILESELRDLRERGYLPICQQVFSRTSAPAKYVQDRLRAHQSDLLTWIAEGAYIYVCGSYDGMGRNVHLTLTDILGEDRVDNLLDAGRYCRDTY